MGFLDAGWTDLLPFIAIGFVAQLIDGALGMSLPMTFANRLIGDWRHKGFLVFSHFDPEGIPSTMRALLDRCKDILFRPDQPSGVVILAPGRIARGGIDMLVIAEDQAAARQLSEEAIARFTVAS